VVVTAEPAADEAVARLVARKRPLVLVVDDEASIRLLCRVNLRLEQLDTEEAADGATALRLARELRPDLVLLDVMMPEMDGWEMLRQLHERHGMGAIPVIVFSGQVEEDAGEVAARGAQAFIGKPFSPQSLIERTKALLPA
jgi:CheY-like chemotaxis protein